MMKANEFLPMMQGCTRPHTHRLEHLAVFATDLVVLKTLKDSEDTETAVHFSLCWFWWCGWLSPFKRNMDSWWLLSMINLIFGVI